MSDSLASVRRVLRQIQSAQRKALKKKMNGYNSLSKKSTCDSPEYDRDGAKTTNDVINETLAIRNSHGKGEGGRRFSVSHTSQDALFQEASIVQPEVREAWHAKCNMTALLTDDVKQLLIQQAKGDNVALLRTARERDEYIRREIKLDALAKWMVYMWTEGYDPDKHPKRA